MTRDGDEWRGKAEEEDARRLEVSGTWLREAAPTPQRPHARARLVGWVIALVDRTWRRLAGPAGDTRVTENRQAVRDASQIVVQAAAGRLEAASLDGDLKRAQIAQLYAQATRDNAEAKVLNEEAAAKRIENALRLAEAFGVRASVERLPDGTFALVLGGAVIQQLSGEAAPGAGASDEGSA